MDFAVSNRPLDKFKADALILVLGKNSDLPESLPETRPERLLVAHPWPRGARARAGEPRGAPAFVQFLKRVAFACPKDVNHSFACATHEHDVRPVQIT